MHQQWSRTFENSDVATQLVPVPPYACAFLRKSLLNYLIYCIYFALSRPQQIELLHVASHAFKPSQGGWTSPHSGISSTSTGRWNRCDTWRNLRSSRASPWCLGCWECRTNASPGERRRRCNLLRIMTTVTSTMSRGSTIWSSSWSMCTMRTMPFLTNESSIATNGWKDYWWFELLP